MFPVAKKRRPIRSLFRKEIEASHTIISGICSKFDMYLKLNTADLASALKFTYLEHLFRITTSEGPSNSTLKRLSPEIIKILNARQTSVSTSHYQYFTEVYGLLDELTLESISMPNVHCVLYTIKKSRIEEQVIEPLSPSRAPIVHLLQLPNKFIVLYTQLMTFLDGFDPSSGSEKRSIIPPSLIEKSRRSLILNQSVMSIESESDLAVNNEEGSDTPEELRGGAVFSPIDFLVSEEALNSFELDSASIEAYELLSSIAQPVEDRQKMIEQEQNFQEINKRLQEFGRPTWKKTQRQISKARHNYCGECLLF